jgi:MurNAc alpha-1-phosphate uridylyltransferase
MRAMILAAGRGERMRPLTDTTPKPLLAVGGKPLIEYHLEALAGLGVREVVVNLAWLGQQIREALGSGERWGIRIEYSREEQGALETGGGIFQALPLLGSDPFIVLSGDIWSDYSLHQLPRLAASDVAHFVLVPNPDFHARGDFGLHNDRVTDGAADQYTYANIGVFKPEFFAACRAGKFPLAPLMFDWIRQGRVSGELFPGRWCNVGTPSQLEQLDGELRSRPG